MSDAKALSSDHDAARTALRAPVRSVIEWYFSCVDRRDWAGLDRCFLPNATAEYNSGKKMNLTGRPAIVERVSVVKKFLATNHLLSNTNIAVDGDRADAETLAIAHLIDHPAEDARVYVRGIRYTDRLVNTADGWRIEHRIHQPLWQYIADAVAPNY